MFLLLHRVKLDNDYINDICAGTTDCKRKIAFTLIVYYTLNFFILEALNKKILEKDKEIGNIDKIQKFQRAIHTRTGLNRDFSKSFGQGGVKPPHSQTQAKNLVLRSRNC
ncbi:MAG: hypothetical protein IJH67_06340 [Thermoguttaceae bacterium]|nr:hypothetical protein [Thermoguttaceae bacterium]